MRLLLIEDDDVLRTTLTSDFERAGFAVDCAVDGETGEFLGSTEHYDVTVLDLGLPRMNGLEILRRWRASGATVPVIVLTARDQWHECVEGRHVRPGSPATASSWTKSTRARSSAARVRNH